MNTSDKSVFNYRLLYFFCNFEMRSRQNTAMNLDRKVIRTYEIPFHSGNHTFAGFIFAKCQNAFFYRTFDAIDAQTVLN